MNEQIKELAKQAGVYFGEAHKDYFGEEHPAYISTRDIDVQKFAELIVAECEQAIRAEVAITDISGEVEKAWGMGMECGVYTIKKHFGVNE